MGMIIVTARCECRRAYNVRVHEKEEAQAVEPIHCACGRTLVQAADVGIGTADWALGERPVEADAS